MISPHKFHGKLEIFTPWWAIWGSPRVEKYDEVPLPWHTRALHWGWQGQLPCSVSWDSPPRRLGYPIAIKINVLVQTHTLFDPRPVI